MCHKISLIHIINIPTIPNIMINGINANDNIKVISANFCTNFSIKPPLCILISKLNANF